MSFRGGFLTGRSISRRTGGGGGYGGAALSIATMTQKARGVIRPVSTGGGGGGAEPGVFKDVLADISSPTFEFLMSGSNADRPGSISARSTWPLNTGTESEGPGAIYYNDGSFTGGGAMTTEALDSFDGYAQLDGVASHMSSINSLSRDSILRREDRSWIFVWDSLDGDGVAAALETATTGQGDFKKWAVALVTAGAHTTFNGPGHIFTSVASTPNVVRIEHNGADVELTAGNGTHSSGGTATGLLLDGGIRTVLIVTYTHSGETTTIRWKQTGHDSSGHTYITQDSAAEEIAGGALGYTWAGSSGYYHWYPSVNNARHRYVGIVDHVITASEFDDLALAARVTDPDI